jgi:hypothetical protein
VISGGHFSPPIERSQREATRLLGIGFETEGHGLIVRLQGGGIIPNHPQWPLVGLRTLAHRATYLSASRF